MSELLDWVENAAIENLRLQHHTADVIARESVTTLTLLLAGVGAGVAYAAKSVDRSALDWLSVGAISVTAYLAVLCLILVVRCLRISPLPAIYNEPGNLLQPDIEFEDLRRYELENMQTRINDAVRRNARIAGSLNRVRIAAALSPLVFIIFAACWEQVAG